MRPAAEYYLGDGKLLQLPSYNLQPQAWQSAGVAGL